MGLSDYLSSSERPRLPTKEDAAVEFTKRELHRSTAYADQEQFPTLALAETRTRLDILEAYSTDFPAVLSILALIKNRWNFECDQRHIENQPKQEPHE